jgi:phosphoribosylformylglycinamidine synthase
MSAKQANLAKDSGLNTKTRPVALVLRGDGINCEEETVQALGLAGFEAKRVTCLDLKDSPKLLSQASALVLPGGFSFGDEVRSGKILAVKLRAYIFDALAAYADRGGLILGICNGFQVLVQLGILPGGQVLNLDSERPLTLAHNSGGKFIDRWVELKVSNGSAFTRGLPETIWLPVRHGEGRLVLREEVAGLEDLVSSLACLSYLDDLNGSFQKIAGLTSRTGKVMGLMPHPECFVRASQHPAWTASRNGDGEVMPGLQIFQNMFAMLQ